jgi:NAD(P)-dependent dehydrogenase (short-subunit alcohol dehydrogenase family)
LGAAIVVGVCAAAITRMLLRPRPPQSSFQGQTVLITGGSRGLGLEAARRWAAEGARVVLCARTAKDIERAVNELRSKGGSAYGFQCDVTSRQQVERLVATVIDRWGAIDVLVNNAGIIQVGPQSCMNLQDYRRALETHLWGPLYAIEAVLPHMRRRRRGRIVNVASIGGEISVPHLLPYSASKNSPGTVSRLPPSARD